MSHCGSTISVDYISDVNYADDTVTNESDPVHIIRTLESIALHIFWAKMNVENIAAAQAVSDLLINGQIVEGLQGFVDLGISISSTDAA